VVAAEVISYALSPATNTDLNRLSVDDEDDELTHFGDSRGVYCVHNLSLV